MGPPNIDVPLILSVHHEGTRRILPSANFPGSSYDRTSENSMHRQLSFRKFAEAETLFLRISLLGDS
jgi:hypothetical protein